MEKYLRQNKAITIISLIITIVILLILAGILIAILTGENGLISRTKIAKERMEEAKAKESLELKITSIQTEKQGDAKLYDLDNLTIDGYNVTTSSIGRIITMTKDGKIYTFFCK